MQLFFLKWLFVLKKIISLQASVQRYMIYINLFIINILIFFRNEEIVFFTESCGI